MDVIRIIFAILLPPGGVLLQVGLRGHLWLNILLTLLGYCPGIVHAGWIIARRWGAGNVAAGESPGDQGETSRRKILGSSIALAAIAVFALAFAQPRPPTTEERVTALESALATLEMRFGLESS